MRRLRPLLLAALVGLAFASRAEAISFTEFFNCANTGLAPSTITCDQPWRNMSANIGSYMSIVSNHAQDTIQAPDSESVLRADVNLATATHYAEAKVTVPAGNTNTVRGGMAVRMDGTGDTPGSNSTYYQCRLDFASDTTKAWNILKFNSGSYTGTIAGPTSVTWTAGDILGCSASGAGGSNVTVTIYKNRVSIGSGVDASGLSSSFVRTGIIGRTNSGDSPMQLDDFQACDGAAPCAGGAPTGPACGSANLLLGVGC